MIFHNFFRKLPRHLSLERLDRLIRDWRLYIDSKIAPPISSDDVTKSLRDLEVDDGDKIIQQINLEYSGLYSKASSLLTHVSMMIAALSFVFGTEKLKTIKILILLNIIFYLVSLIFILRVIWVPVFEENELQERRKILARELDTSQKYLRIAHFMAVALTFLVIVLLAVSIL